MSLTSRGTGGDLTYRWRRNGVPLINDYRTIGADARTLVISAAEATDEGAYDVVISNGDGSTTTSTASVTVAIPCPADIAGGDGAVTVGDLLALISAWGPCVEPDPCSADIAPSPDGNGVVNVGDLLALIGAWGACP